MNFWRMAARNLWRSPRRTLLSTGSVVAGVAVLILGRGFIAGFSEGLIRGQVDALSSHVLLRPADYPTVGLDHPLDPLLNMAEITPSLAETPKWTARTLFVPQVTHGQDSVRARAIAIDPSTDDAIFPKTTWGVRGALPRSADEGVAASQGIASLLNLSVGDTVVLQARTRQGAINALEVPVSGIYSAGNAVLDSYGLLLTHELANTLVREGAARSHVAILLDRRGLAEGVASRLRSELPPGVSVATWQDETADMMRLQSVRQRALDLVVLALLGMSATGIANTVLMAAYERIREVGTLRALGMTRSQVVQLFVIEGALMGGLGALIGAALGSAIVGYFQVQGIDLSSLIGSATGGNIPYATMLYTYLDPLTVLMAALFGVLTAVLASIYPALVASRMPPAEAVRA